MSELGIDIQKLSLTPPEEEKVVSFAGHNLKLDTEGDADKVVEAIKTCPGMTTLKLEGNTIGVSAAKAIAKALESQPKFRKALWNDMFTQRTEHEIPDALNYLSSGIILANARLVELDLSDNAFGPRGLRGIINLLKSAPCYTLKELRLNNNGLGISGGKMLAAALSQCVVNSRKSGSPLSLKLFICGRNRLENEGSSALADFFKEVGTLEYIAMPQNGINAEGIAALAAAFAKNPNLKFVSLEDNTFTSKGAEVMAKHLPTLKNLETINFGDCLLKTQGAKVLGEALKGNFPHLKELILGFNEISTEGGLAIIEGLSDKHELVKLDLNGNKFGESGIQDLRIKMDHVGKGNLLGDLSGDEGVEEDESDDDIHVVSDESDNEDESKENIEGPVSVSDFLLNPNASKLISLHKVDTNLESFLPEGSDISNYFDLFVKLTLIFRPGNEKLENAVCHYCDLIFEKLYDMFLNNIWILNNELAVRLGFIKDEGKDKKILNDVTGALSIINGIIKKKYFHTTTKSLLQEFLSNPVLSQKVSADMKVKHNLLQALYQA